MFTITVFMFRLRAYRKAERYCHFGFLPLGEGQISAFGNQLNTKTVQAQLWFDEGFKFAKLVSMQHIRIQNLSQNTNLKPETGLRTTNLNSKTVSNPETQT